MSTRIREKKIVERPAWVDAEEEHTIKIEMNNTADSAQLFINGHPTLISGSDSFVLEIAEFIIQEIKEFRGY